jgi:hypothetical protein
MEYRSILQFPVAYCAGDVVGHRGAAGGLQGAAVERAAALFVEKPALRHHLYRWSSASTFIQRVWRFWKFLNKRALLPSRSNRILG